MSLRSFRPDNYAMSYKSPRKNRVNAKDYYAPSTTLVRFIGNLLRLETAERELDEREDAGEDFDKALKKVKHDRLLLNRRKVDVLNIHVFQSMANLTYLLEMMRQEPIIRDRFDEDIRDLFLTSSSLNDSSFMKNKCIFERFIGASCRIMVDEKGELVPDFRMVLLDIMQRLISKIMVVVGERHFDDPSLWKDAMKPDLQRAVAWVSEVSYKARVNEVRKEKRRKKAAESKDDKVMDSARVTRPAQF